MLFSLGSDRFDAGRCPQSGVSPATDCESVEFVRRSIMARKLDHVHDCAWASWTVYVSPQLFADYACGLVPAM